MFPSGNTFSSLPSVEPHDCLRAGCQVWSRVSGPVLFCQQLEGYRGEPGPEACRDTEGEEPGSWITAQNTDRCAFLTSPTHNTLTFCPKGWTVLQVKDNSSVSHWDFWIPLFGKVVLLILVVTSLFLTSKCQNMKVMQTIFSFSKVFVYHDLLGYYF